MPRRVEKTKTIPDAGQESLPHDEQTKELLTALTNLRLQPKYSDLIIECGDDFYEVHRCVVWTRAEFFAKACDGQFKEASSHTIKLNEDTALVKQMVDYLYTLDYQVELDDSLSKSGHNTEIDDSRESCSPPKESRPLPQSQASEAIPTSSKGSPLRYNPLSFHILMYSLADRMVVEGLKALSRERVAREMLYHLEADSFKLAVHEIYHSTPTHERGLRDVAVQITMANLTTLRSSDEDRCMALPDSLLESIPQFSHDLLLAVLDKSVSTWNQHRSLGRDFAEYVWY